MAGHSFPIVNRPLFGMPSQQVAAGSEGVDEKAPTQTQVNPLEPEGFAFAAFTGHSVSKGPPPTPLKKRKAFSSFESLVLQIVKSKKIVYCGTPFDLEKLKAEGRYKSLYAVLGKTPIIPSCPCRVYVKTYLERCLLVERPGTVERWHRTSIAHHDQLVLEGFPIVPILNIKTAAIDGFFIVPHVEMFKPSDFWNSKTDLKSLSEQGKAYLLQLRDLFRRSFDSPSKFPNDLQGNLGIMKTKDGNQLSLCDFIESSEGKDTPYAFHLYAKKHLEWYANGNPAVYQFLLSAVLHSKAPDALKTYNTFNIDGAKRVIDFDADFTPTVVEMRTVSAAKA